MSKELDKAKASTTGIYSRSDKTIYDDFVRECKNSKIKGVNGQSQKEVIIEKLLMVYNQNGDNVFDFIFKK